MPCARESGDGVCVSAALNLRGTEGVVGGGAVNVELSRVEGEGGDLMRPHPQY